MIADQCYEIVRNDLAFVSVYFGTGSYVKTVMDTRVTFTDQLGSLGKPLKINIIVLIQKLL